MADRDEGATVRLAATIARSRHEADGGTLLGGIHPDTIVEMSLAAKREVDSLRAELAEAREKLARLRPTNEIRSAREAARRRMRLDGADAQALEHALTITERERDEVRADLARVTAERDKAIAIYRVSDHQRDEACRDRDRAMAERDAEIAQLRAELEEAVKYGNDYARRYIVAMERGSVLLLERDAARADLARMTRDLADERAAVAIAHERIAEVTAERDARPEISREDARAWTSDGIPYGEQVRAGAAIDEALRAHAAEASEPSPPPTAPPLLEWGPDGPRLSEYERKRLEREAEDALDGVCDECGGYLYVGEYGSLGMCPACNGTGRAGGPNA